MFRLVEGEARLWGRSTDLCREGIGVTVVGELTPEELVAMQIPLPATKSVTVRASVRYCNQVTADLNLLVCTISSARRFTLPVTGSEMSASRGETEAQ